MRREARLAWVAVILGAAFLFVLLSTEEKPQVVGPEITYTIVEGLHEQVRCALVEEYNVVLFCEGLGQ